MRQVEGLLEGEFDVFMIETQQDLLETWAYVREGYRVIFEEQEFPINMTLENYWKVCSWVVGCNPDKGYGAIFMYKRKGTDEVVGHLVVTDATERFSDRELLQMYMVYSHKEEGKRVINLKNHVAVGNWYGKKFGYTTLQSFTPRFSGAIKRVYVKLAGFEPVALVFHKTIQYNDTDEQTS